MFTMFSFSFESARKYFDDAVALIPAMSHAAMSGYVGLVTASVAVKVLRFLFSSRWFATVFHLCSGVGLAAFLWNRVKIE